MRVIVAYKDEQFSRPIEYTFGLMLSTLGFEHEILPCSKLTAGEVGASDVLISYAREKMDLNANYQIHIYQSRLFGRAYKTSSSMPQLPLRCWDGLPVIYVGNGNIESLVVRNGDLIETNIDIIASSFFMLSRYEEILIDERDQHSRFPATASVAYKEDFLIRPIVNEYIDLLWKWIDSLNLGFKPKSLWNGKDFAVLLTHDVDMVRKYRWCHPPLRWIANPVLRHGQIAKSLSYFWDWIASSLRIRSDPYWTFKYITGLEHKYDLASSFYFITGESSKPRNGYSIDSSRIVKLMKELEDAGHEIGLHGSLSSYTDYKMLANEKARLSHFISGREYGGRQHNLCWKTPDTWRIWDEAGMLYDTTLGYADHEGFRCGFCLPFKPFDVLDNRVLDIWELPLTVMETTLRVYRGLSSEEAYKPLSSLLDTVGRHHGLFVMLWHNSHLCESEFPGWRHLYECVMDEIGSGDVFNGNGRSIVYYWMETNNDYSRV